MSKQLLVTLRWHLTTLHNTPLCIMMVIYIYIYCDIEKKTKIVIVQLVFSYPLSLRLPNHRSGFSFNFSSRQPPKPTTEPISDQVAESMISSMTHFSQRALHDPANEFWVKGYAYPLLPRSLEENLTATISQEFTQSHFHEDLRLGLKDLKDLKGRWSSFNCSITQRKYF